MIGAMALGAHTLGVMVVMTAMVTAERYRHRPPQSLNALLLGGLAALFSAT
jgi:hypothetical protein